MVHVSANIEGYLIQLSVHKCFLEVIVFEIKLKYTLRE